MTAYVLGHLRTPSSHPDVFEYMERIQATLDPFSGRFRVHGALPEVLEGEWQGYAVLVEFPSIEHARRWYGSAAYREILPLRTDHIEASVILVDGVGPDHDSAALAARLRAQATA
jgi:uncharacterized protein (DUF1330 family)